MRAPGEVLLVACYELGHQPLSLAWPAAFLARAGYAPATLDLAVEPFDAARVARARMIAIAVPMHTALRLGMRALARVRALQPSAHVCFYGLYATLNADYLLAHGVDSVLGGECEEALVALAQRLEREDARAVAPGARPALAKLAFPVPRRTTLPALSRYAQLERDGARVPAAYVEASRGCKHACRHCPIPAVYGGRFFVVPVDVVLADVRQQIAAGARHVTFGDPDFLNGPRHALAVARALHTEFPDVTFDMTAKIEHLLRTHDALPELARLGCAFVVTAAESLDDEVLTILAKGHSGVDVVTALHGLRDAGIAPRPTWLPFTPWTSLDRYRAWLDFVADEQLVDAIDSVQYSIRLLVPPGSLLLEHPAMRPHLRERVDADFYHAWAHPDPRMDALQARVAAAVAGAARRGDDAAVTFDAVRALADETAGTPRRPPLRLPPQRARPPRLTEAWFC